MSKRKVSIDDIVAVLFQPAPEFRMILEKSALLLINFVDYMDFFVKTAVEAGMPKVEVHEALNDFDLRARKAANNAGRLLKACRGKGIEIIHVKPEHTTSINREAGLMVPLEKEALTVYPVAKSRRGELVFPKVDGEAFTGTKLDFVLRNMNVDNLIICGLMTDQGVLFSTIRAVNLGYNVVLVEDACTTLVREAHEIFIKWYRTFVNVKTTEEVIDLVQKE